jgi:hypothetical protein
MGGSRRPLTAVTPVRIRYAVLRRTPVTGSNVAPVTGRADRRATPPTASRSRSSTLTTLPVKRRVNLCHASETTARPRSDVHGQCIVSLPPPEPFRQRGWRGSPQPRKLKSDACTSLPTLVGHADRVLRVCNLVSGTGHLPRATSGPVAGRRGHRPRDCPGTGWVGAPYRSATRTWLVERVVRRVGRDRLGRSTRPRPAHSGDDLWRSPDERPFVAASQPQRGFRLRCHDECHAPRCTLAP